MMRGFDSIESMNAEELLVKRKRGSKRCLVVTAIIGGLFFLVGILVGYFSHNDSGKTSPQPGPAPSVFKVDEYILQHVTDEFIKKTLSDFSSKPRIAGTKENYELANTIQSLWKFYGLENVHLETYQTLLSFSNESDPNKVELYNTTSSAILASTSASEPALRPEDVTSTMPSYNAFSPLTNISGDIVYANYGRLQDLQYIANNLSIDVTGKVLLVRLGKIYRWIKIKNAERYNASAVILYSDPADINISMKDNDEKYPHSWWLPGTGVQQGPLVDSDALIGSLGYPTKDSAFIPEDQHYKLPRIPCQPVSYAFALSILSNMSGPLAPIKWQGGLSTDYYIGPGWQDDQLQIRVTVNNYFKRGPIHNVVGVIAGRIEPDRYVILGAHHDSWSVGATDPHSGGAALTQIAAIFGDLLRMGYRPRRSLMFCSWDAEELGSIGSKQWIQDHLRGLHEKAIAYVNMDLMAEGNFTLGVESSPLLQDSLYTAATKIPSPQPPFRNFYDLWLNRPNTDEKDLKEPHVSTVYSSLGDHVQFYSDVGVATANIFATFDKQKYNLTSYPLYHSAYDTLYSYETFQDPGLGFTVALTKLVATWANDVANSTVIPFKVTRLAKSVEKILSNVINTYRLEWEKQEVNIDGLTSSLHSFSDAAKQFEERIRTGKDSMSPLKLRMYNDQIIQLQKLFSNPCGLPGMPHIKNILLATDNTNINSVSHFPGITTTMTKIRNGEDLWSVLRRQVSLVTFYIQRAARSLDLNGL